VSAAPTPQWLVERLHAGDLAPEQAAQVRARLEAEGGLARLDALRSDDGAFLEAHPPGPALAEIRRRAAPRRARRPLLAFFIPLTAAGVAVAAVLVLRQPAGRSPTGDLGEEEHTKGLSARLQVHRQRPGLAPEPLVDGAPARAGDVVQLSYVSAGAGYGVVVSVDGRGSVTLHWPERPGPAAKLAARHAVPLAHAYQLDDAPAFERFFLVTSSAPFDSGVVAEAARRLVGSGRPDRDLLPLPAALEQHALLLVKVAP
jgi:hypothetical protein